MSTVPQNNTSHPTPNQGAGADVRGILAPGTQANVPFTSVEQASRANVGTAAANELVAATRAFLEARESGNPTLIEQALERFKEARKAVGATAPDIPQDPREAMIADLLRQKTAAQNALTAATARGDTAAATTAQNRVNGLSAKINEVAPPPPPNPRISVQQMRAALQLGLETHPNLTQAQRDITQRVINTIDAIVRESETSSPAQTRSLMDYLDRHIRAYSAAFGQPLEKPHLDDYGVKWQQAFQEIHKNGTYTLYGDVVPASEALKRAAQDVVDTRNREAMLDAGMQHRAEGVRYAIRNWWDKIRGKDPTLSRNMVTGYQGVSSAEAELYRARMEASNMLLAEAEAHVKASTANIKAPHVISPAPEATPAPQAVADTTLTADHAHVGRPFVGPLTRDGYLQRRAAVKKSKGEPRPLANLKTTEENIKEENIRAAREAATERALARQEQLAALTDSQRAKFENQFQNSTAGRSSGSGSNGQATTRVAPVETPTTIAHEITENVAAIFNAAEKNPSGFQRAAASLLNDQRIIPADQKWLIRLQEVYNTINNPDTPAEQIAELKKERDRLVKRLELYNERVVKGIARSTPPAVAVESRPLLLLTHSQPVAVVEAPPRVGLSMDLYQQVQRAYLGVAIDHPEAIRPELMARLAQMAARQYQEPEKYLAEQMEAIARSERRMRPAVLTKEITEAANRTLFTALQKNDIDGIALALRQVRDLEISITRQIHGHEVPHLSPENAISASERLNAARLAKKYHEHAYQKAVASLDVANFNALNDRLHVAETNLNALEAKPQGPQLRSGMLEPPTAPTPTATQTPPAAEPAAQRSKVAAVATLTPQNNQLSLGQRAIASGIATAPIAGGIMGVWVDSSTKDQTPAATTDSFYTGVANTFLPGVTHGFSHIVGPDVNAVDSTLGTIQTIGAPVAIGGALVGAVSVASGAGLVALGASMWQDAAKAVGLSEQGGIWTTLTTSFNNHQQKAKLAEQKARDDFKDALSKVGGVAKPATSPVDEILRIAAASPAPTPPPSPTNATKDPLAGLAKRYPDAAKAPQDATAKLRRKDDTAAASEVTHTVRAGESLTRIANSKGMRELYKGLETMLMEDARSKLPPGEQHKVGKPSRETVLSIMSIAMAQHIEPEKQTHKDINAVDIGQKVKLTEGWLSETVRELRAAQKLSDKNQLINIRDDAKSIEEIFAPAVPQAAGRGEKQKK